jgi:hypothetical protein
MAETVRTYINYLIVGLFGEFLVLLGINSCLPHAYDATGLGPIMGIPSIILGGILCRCFFVASRRISIKYILLCILTIFIGAGSFFIYTEKDSLRRYQSALDEKDKRFSKMEEQKILEAFKFDQYVQIKIFLIQHASDTQDNFEVKVQELLKSLDKNFISYNIKRVGNDTILLRGKATKEGYEYLRNQKGSVDAILFDRGGS